MAGKLGLGHLETLVENLSRDLNLGSTTLTDPIISTSGSVTASGGVHLSGQTRSNYLDFATGFQGNLAIAAAAVPDAALNAGAASGATEVAGVVASLVLTASTVNSTDFDGNAAGCLYLPPATVDTHLVLEITGDIDEAGPLTIFTTGAVGATGVLAKQVIGPVQNGATAQSVETNGTALVPTDVQMIYTAAAANTNFLGAGSMVHFYCPVAGQWLVKIYNVQEGAGSTGVLTTGAGEL